MEFQTSAALSKFYQAILDPSTRDSVKLRLDSKPYGMVDQRRVERSEALIAAASNGHTDVVRALIDAGADPNYVDRRDECALMHAASKGYASLARLLLHRGGDPEKKDKSGTTALMAASYGGYVDIVSPLLSAGAEPDNSWVETGLTSLFLALFNGHDQVVSELLEAQADPNFICQISGLTYPLFAVIPTCNVHSLQLLLAAGADPNVVNDFGATPLLVAIYHKHLPSIELLVQFGAEIDVPCQNPKLLHAPGDTPLSFAAAHSTVEITEFLLSHGADPNYVSDFGSPLKHAAMAGRPEIVDLLIKSGSDVNAAGVDHSCALSWACVMGHAECVRLLIDAGADVNWQDNADRTALFYACVRGKTDCVEIILSTADKTGLDPNLPDVDGTTPLMGAILHLQEDIARRLIHSSLEVNLDQKRLDGQSALSLAILVCSDLIVDIAPLSQLVNALWTPSGKPTTLMLAADRPFALGVETLLKNGADPNVCGSNNTSPLLAASIRGDSDCVRVLLDAGADPNICRTNNESPLTAAAQFGHFEVVRLLLDAGADVMHVKSDNFSALSAALLRGHQEIAELLVSHTPEPQPLYHTPFMEAQGFSPELGRTRIMPVKSDDHFKFYQACCRGKIDGIIISSEMIHSKSVDGMTPLAFAAQEGQLSAVDTLLDAGADPHTHYLGVECPLLSAALNGHLDVLSRLLEN